MRYSTGQAIVVDKDERIVVLLPAYVEVTRGQVRDGARTSYYQLHDGQIFNAGADKAKIFKGYF